MGQHSTEGLPGGGGPGQGVGMADRGPLSKKRLNACQCPTHPSSLLPRGSPCHPGEAPPSPRATWARQAPARSVPALTCPPCTASLRERTLHARCRLACQKHELTPLSLSRAGCTPPHRPCDLPEVPQPSRPLPTLPHQRLPGIARGFPGLFALPGTMTAMSRRPDGAQDSLAPGRPGGQERWLDQGLKNPQA